jgi:uncharacterized protein YjbJ (UPF0337 family)
MCQLIDAIGLSAFPRNQGSPHSLRGNDSRSQEAVMNWDQIKGKWTQYKGKAKQQWRNLTDDELDQADGNKDQLVGKIQEKYGIAREEAERQVEDWSQRME